MDDTKWRTNPCPLNPDWGLHDISDLDHAKLKTTIDTDNNVKEMMVIETLIYRAFLAYPKEKGIFYNQTPNRRSEALEYLLQADECTRDLCRNSEEAKIGYGIVINTFRMWITPDVTCASTLKTLEAKKEQYPGHQAYVNVVHAYILSRLGPRWRGSAMSLYQNALSYSPRNYQWLFGRALMIGRKARQQRSIVGWKGLLPVSIRKIFKEEEQLLRTILRIKPMFHLARAFYGQVLFNLDKRSRTAATEIRKALNGSPDNLKICILAAKFYRVKGPFEKAEILLKNIIEKVNIAEVHCQLGCLYRSRSYRFHDSHREQILSRALHHFKTALELDNCHYPAVTGSAEMHALLGNVDTARNMYKDILEEEFKDKPHQVSNEYHMLASALKLKLNLFKPLEDIKLSHRLIEIIVTLTAESNGIVQVPRKSLDHTKMEQLKKLEKYNVGSDPNQNANVRREARLKLASAKLLLQEIDEATRLYDQLYEDYKACAEVIFHRGKCYFHKGNQARKEQAVRLWGSVIQMADELSEIPGSECCFSLDELYADVHLARAKASAQSSHHGTNGRNLETWEQLKLAIQRRSLEACYDYISPVQVLKDNFFLDDIPHGRIPETLAEIQCVCNIDKPLHTQFTATLRDGSQVVNDVAAKKNFIMSVVDEVIKYDVIICPDSAKERLSSISLQLNELRENRLQYEVELRRSKKVDDWGKPYRKTLSGVIGVARQILDNCISICQSALMEDVPYNSMFLILKPGKIDKDKCKREVDKWAKKIFPGTNIPDGFLQKIVEIQPMYDEENIWLWALHSLNNLKNHSASRCDAGETFTVQLDTTATDRHLKTEVIVKESCQGVVNLVVDLIKTCSFGAKSEE